MSDDKPIDIDNSEKPTQPGTPRWNSKWAKPAAPGADGADAKDQAAAQAGATDVVGKYQIVRVLGKGGMGKVYLALNPNTGEQVAVKTLPEDAAENEQTVERFRREARLATKVQHANVVRVLDADYDPERNLHFIVMEYVDGQNLAQIVRQREGELPWQEALGYIIAVTKALVVAEDKGIIHRDIKPANIMVSAKGEIKLADLGLAKHLGEVSELTLSSQIVGTPHYMAPEQVGGTKDLDVRSDIYSLGATFYYLVTGKAPFRADSTFELLRQIKEEPITDPCVRCPSLPKHVRDVILKMMAKDPAERYQHAAELLDDLTILVNESCDEAGSKAKLSVAFSGTQRLRAAAGIVLRKGAGVAVALGVVLVIIGLLSLGLSGSDVEQTPSADSVAIVRELMELSDKRVVNETDYWTSAPRMVSIASGSGNPLGNRFSGTRSRSLSQLISDTMQQELDRQRIVLLTRQEQFEEALREVAMADTGAFSELHKARLGQLLSVHQSLRLGWESPRLGSFPLSLTLEGTVQETGQLIRCKADCASREALPQAIGGLVRDFFKKYYEVYPLQALVLGSGRLENKDSLQINIGGYHGVEEGMVFGVYERKEREVGGQNRPFPGMEPVAHGRVTRANKAESVLEIVGGSLPGHAPETVLLRQAPNQGSARQ